MSNRYCIIGAGASGLAVAKTFAERGIPFDCIERETEIGGLWNPATPSGVVYETCHMLSSKEFSGYLDFPMSEDLPVFPSHSQALDYLKSYAAHFGLERHIQLGKTVSRAERTPDGWMVRIEGDDQPRHYKGLVIANGHHCEPRWPEYRGTFAGEYIHSRDYRSPKQLTGKRVLVIGGGNSACDVAIDAAHHGAISAISLRRGYYFVPKFLFGQPIDDVYEFVERFRLPRGLRQFLYGLSHWLFTGPPERFGLPKPDHGILESHTTITSDLPNMVSHGRIAAKPDVASFDGNTVHFTDGTQMTADMVVCATGYRLAAPFIDRSELYLPDGHPNLFVQTFHPERDDLFVAGLVQGNGSMWRLAELQAKLISSYIVAKEYGDASAERFASMKRATAEDVEVQKRSFVKSKRHRLETDFHVYRRRLEKLLKGFGKFAEAPMPSSVVGLPLPTPAYKRDEVGTRVSEAAE
ncbi:MAG: NAD(P)-binding domain-containing protein [Pseudomonadota bacterium]|nr:NAD(P)-binding domain-containing protein [Pseudomonadota bacterium]